MDFVLFKYGSTVDWKRNSSLTLPMNLLHNSLFLMCWLNILINYVCYGIVIVFCKHAEIWQTCCSQHRHVRWPWMKHSWCKSCLIALQNEWPCDLVVAIAKTSNGKLSSFETWNWKVLITWLALNTWAAWVSSLCRFPTQFLEKLEKELCWSGLYDIARSNDVTIS